MTDPAFFGYGSLVNLATHDYTNPRPARLAGWRRVWRQTRLRETAFLSVEPCPATTLDGVIAKVPGADWGALDLREAAYLRIDISDSVHHEGDRGQTAVYRVDPAHMADDGSAVVILLSYLDVVVQGYLRMYGEAGVARLFATTHDWGAIHDDRASPQYPRHQPLSPLERELVDHHVNVLRVRQG
jgi:hypothetical protein